jgi:hypothetical protein
MDRQRMVGGFLRVVRAAWRAVLFTVKIILADGRGLFKDFFWAVGNGEGSRGAVA